MLPVKVTILGFVGYTDIFKTTQLCHCSMKTAQVIHKGVRVAML